MWFKINYKIVIIGILISFVLIFQNLNLQKKDNQNLNSNILTDIEIDKIRIELNQLKQTK